MSMRLVTLALAALLTFQGVAAEADCLADGASCGATEVCPRTCCTGVPPRTTSRTMYCPSTSAVFRDTTSTNNTGGFQMAPVAAPMIASMTAATPAPMIASMTAATTTPTTTDPPSSPIEGGEPTSTPTTAGSNTNADNHAPVPPAAAVPAPTPAAVTQTQTPAAASGRTDSVDAFQSAQSLSGSRSTPGGPSMVFIAVGALAGCVVLVAAVMYKRKTSATQSLEVPGSSYHGSNGSGLTPDNRSLDGMMESGVRGSNDSMKQLPVLSLAGDGSSVARMSSPFGGNTARISSPAHRGGTNEDYAFDVEMGGRAGSSVQVAFVDASHTANSNGQTTEFAAEQNGNGVVAL